MANKKNSKKNSYSKKAARQAQEEVIEFAKKKPTAAIIIVVVIILVIALAAAGYYFLVYKKKNNGVNNGLNGGKPNGSVEISAGDLEEISSADLSIHFLELGHRETGDCTLIKVGNTELLIDAGATNASAETIVPYIDKYCTDGILEYVIATHAHEDHIGAFYSTGKRAGIFESFECKTIIDFPMVSPYKVINNSKDNKNTVYGKYCDARDKEVTLGAKHYTALECWNETNGAQKTYQLSSTVSFSVLYQKYYEEYDGNNKESNKSENNYSVCILLQSGSDSFLFTGDLEEEGESSLVDNNTLPHCKLYKAGHHGSKTSSHNKMLAKITPEVVCVCCCAGSPQYTLENNNTFPTQDFVDRVGQYTDKIYVTTLATNISLGSSPSTSSWEYTSMNGNIVYYYGKSDEEEEKSYKIWCSNNTTILKETAWFKENRVWRSV